MADLKYATAGESHGKGLIALVEGLPAGMALDLEAVEKYLKRRQGGYGRGGRQAIEEDRAEPMAGVKGGKTLGSPLALWIANRDATLDSLPPVLAPRPGHADLPGCLKVGCKDAREILERSSARETAARTAAGAVALQLLQPFGVRVFGSVIELGDVKAPRKPVKQVTPALEAQREASLVRCLDPEASEVMMRAVDAAREAGDTLGGTVEVNATGVLPGLGGFDRWEARLDARLAAALMGIPSVKAVEIGAGFLASRQKGSDVHDEILFNPALIADGKPHGFFRASNRAGGIEGGLSNGETITVRAGLKPIPTLAKPLKTVNIATGRGDSAATERADICAVPSAVVIAEAVVAFELARTYREKFGGDSLEEMSRNFEGYVASLRDFLP
ncbi:MAG: chorismate synthase [Planctomycetota bacterium]|jgi:chorismate synthase